MISLKKLKEICSESETYGLNEKQISHIKTMVTTPNAKTGIVASFKEIDSRQKKITDPKKLSDQDNVKKALTELFTIASKSKKPTEVEKLSTHVQPNEEESMQLEKWKSGIGALLFYKKGEYETPDDVYKNFSLPNINLDLLRNYDQSFQMAIFAKPDLDPSQIEKIKNKIFEITSFVLIKAYVDQVEEKLPFAETRLKELNEDNYKKFVAEKSQDKNLLKNMKNYCYRASDGYF